MALRKEDKTVGEERSKQNLGTSGWVSGPSAWANRVRVEGALEWGSETLGFSSSPNANEM